jgi:hypothetical protein
MALRDWSVWHIVAVWIFGLGAAWLLGRFGLRAIAGGGGGIALVTTVATMLVAGALLLVTLRWFRVRLMR